MIATTCRACGIEITPDRAAILAGPEPALAPIVTLFPMDAAPECEGCGALLSAGLRYCRDCDPYTA